jgi:hypothetical protein
MKPESIKILLFILKNNNNSVCCFYFNFSKTIKNKKIVLEKKLSFIPQLRAPPLMVFTHKRSLKAKMLRQCMPVI